MYPLGTSLWKPSAISAQPIIMRKLSASTFNDGCRSMKSLMYLEKKSMNTRANITAAIITPKWRAIPTAVITKTGALPSGLAFQDNGDGTASISGIPQSGTAGTYPLTFNADSGLGYPYRLVGLRVIRVDPYSP